MALGWQVFKIFKIFKIPKIPKIFKIFKNDRDMGPFVFQLLCWPRYWSTYTLFFIRNRFIRN